MDEKDFYTVAEAARYLSKTSEEVEQLAQTGLISGALKKYTKANRLAQKGFIIIDALRFRSSVDLRDYCCGLP